MLVIAISCQSTSAQTATPSNFFPANHALIRYTGRIDFSQPQSPKGWQPGVSMEFQFKGTDCAVILHDEVLWAKNHNYLEIVVDGIPYRTQTKSKVDTIWVAKQLPYQIHRVLVFKNTEANIGYLEFAGVICSKLIPLPPRPPHRIECIGNSITCGTGSDQSVVPCGKGVWQDQHNAYLSYGAITARLLQADVHLSSVSGIGLMHSCCNLDFTMPQVFDNINMRNDSIQWNFDRYQPEVVTICLGQNDGIQDAAVFCQRYVSFLQQIRKVYPKAQLICLTSPMADADLLQFMKKVLPVIVSARRNAGDRKVDWMAFSRSYNSGCDQHPSLEEHQLIALELTAFLRKKMHW